MTRSIEALTPLERKQMLEAIKWNLEISLKPIEQNLDEMIHKVDSKFSKLSHSESDELDNSDQK